jgi:hypothetical protein
MIDLVLPDFVGMKMTKFLNSFSKHKIFVVENLEISTYRIVKKDGNYFICTRDYRLDRLNLSIENEVIICATIG